MRYLSVCSGIEAATAAWHPLGWEAAAFSEIEKFPRAVLQHHYPEVPLHGDFTTIEGGEYGAIDLLVGGTPCQSFSIAGLRGGLADDRGNLALEFLRLAQRTRAQWVVWENVPGVLSIDAGRAFGAILGGLGELGYGFAYRVLDAQYFGVPQRRRRVFVIGHLGDWRRAAAVLFERHGLQGHPAPRREKGQNAPTIPARSTGGGGLRTDFDCDGGLIEAVSPPLTGPPYGDNSSREGLLVHAPEIARCVATREGSSQDFETTTMIAHALTGEGFDASEDGTGRGTPLVPVAFMENQQGAVWESDCFQALNKGGGKPGQGYPAISHASQVRRLTPRECDRLQGFPDDYTLIPWRGKLAEECPDGPRYKALGNSMAVPCMRWIGERIAAVDALEILPESLAA